MLSASDFPLSSVGSSDVRVQISPGEPMNNPVPRDVAIPSSYVSVDKVATYLNLSKQAVYDLAGRGLIPHYHIGRRLRFVLAEVHHWVQSSNRGE